MKIDDTESAFFWRHVVMGPNGCWVWTGVMHPRGYGWAKRNVLAHRWIYEHMVGPIPAGLCIDHLCRNRRCQNPAHMEPVTLAENTRRGGNAIKTHCPVGHPYSMDNTYIEPDGIARRCRACARELDRQPHRLSSYRRAQKAS